MWNAHPHICGWRRRPVVREGLDNEPRFAFCRRPAARSRNVRECPRHRDRRAGASHARVPDHPCRCILVDAVDLERLLSCPGGRSHCLVGYGSRSTSCRWGGAAGRSRKLTGRSHRIVVDQEHDSANVVLPKQRHRLGQGKLLKSTRPSWLDPRVRRSRLQGPIVTVWYSLSRRMLGRLFSPLLCLAVMAWPEVGDVRDAAVRDDGRRPTMARTLAAWAVMCNSAS